MGQKTTGSTSTVNPAANSPVNAEPKPTFTAIPVTEYMKHMSAPTGLSAEGVAYFKQIEDYIVSNKATIEIIPITTTRAEGRAYLDSASKITFVLIAAESYRNIDGSCLANLTTEFSTVLKSLRPDAALRQCIEVVKADYTKAANMAAFIINSIAAKKSEGELTLDSYKGIRFSIITRKEAVDEFVAAVSPHAIPARNDNGILICVDVPTGQFDRHQRAEYVAKPIMAVTGYTRFLCPQNTGAQKYIPLALITDIVSCIPNRAVLPLALAFAADAYCNRQIWSRPYTKFAEKGAPNLGSLFTDPTSNKPFKIATLDEFNRFSNDSLMKPFIGLDITEGRARLLEIDALVTKDGRANFKSYMGIFGGQSWDQNLANTIGDITIWWGQNNTGTFAVNGVQYDTRCADYLKMLDLLNDPVRARAFLFQDPNPNAHIALIREAIGDGVQNLYRTDTLAFHSTFMNCLIGMVNKGELNFQYDVADTTHYSVDAFMNTNANQFVGFTGGFNNSGDPWTQGATIYNL